MSRDFPAQVDPWRMVESRSGFSGTWPVARLKRLATLLEAPVSGDVEFSIQFGRDALGMPLADIKAKAAVPLRCQRTLERFVHRLAIESRLGLIRSDSEVDALPDDREPLVVEDASVALTALVEDELILALPLVPLSDGEALEQGFGPELALDESSAAASPFAVLETLKNKR